MAGLRRQRLPDWEERLAALISARLDCEYTSGVNDCAQFAGQCVEAVVGENPAADFRGRYGSYREGLRLLRAEKGVLLAGFMRRLFGRPAAPLLLRRGDIVRRGNALGVRWGAGGLFVGVDEAEGRAGLVPVPLHEIRDGWRVGP